MGKLFNLKEKDIDLLIQIQKKGHMTKEDSDCSGFQYYPSIWRLRDLKLITMNGIENNNQKIWKLSDKGTRMCEYFIMIKNILEDKNEREQRNEGESDNISQ